MSDSFDTATARDPASGPVWSRPRRRDTRETLTGAPQRSGVLEGLSASRSASSSPQRRDRSPASGEAVLALVLAVTDPADRATLLLLRFRDPRTVEEWRVWRRAAASFERHASRRRSSTTSSGGR